MSAASDSRQRQNVALLATAQALMLSAVVLAMTLGAILGDSLAPDRRLATLPIVAMVIGTALTSLPAAMLMRRLGRRNGFLLGTLFGAGGSLLCALGLQQQSFALFVAGHLLIGSYQGFANYYRFAAVEAVDASRASRAISWVVAGGIVAAFLGPQLAVSGRDWLATTPFLGAYLAQAGLSLLALAVLSRLALPPAAAPGPGDARPLRELLAQPALRIAILGAATGYAVMIMVMAATPLAMLGCGLGRGDVAPVIQWHVVGMFAPSFFTGALIKRFGAPRIMQAGFLLLLAQIATVSSGNGFAHFLSALVLLGVGWNFAFIGGTALLTQTYRPAEQMKVQAVNEFAVFGLVAVATLSAGGVYQQFGWTALNFAVAPLLALALFAASIAERRLRLAAIL
ncbi:MAG: MFS transporter [Rhodocyclales bacterium]|nr:MFS transporter [Rhodocyclales bacterium]